MSSTEQPQESLPPAPRQPLTLARIETMVSRAIVGFGLVFGVLVVPAFLAQQSRLVQPLALIEAIALCAGLLAAAVAAALRRGVAVATVSFAVLYLLIVALWPTTAAGAPVDGTPWLWTLCTVAIAYATVGMDMWTAAVYAVVAPALFGVVMWDYSDGSVWKTALLDAVYAAIVGGVILTIASLLRSAAGSVDAAQKAALDGYERGLREHLGEAERVEVDALVHDSVLTTLLAAAKAHTPEGNALAARMAQDALGHLSSTKPLPTPLTGEVTDAATLVSGIRTAAAALPYPIGVFAAVPLTALLPSGVAEALHAATVQAMLNSSQHAGGAEVARTVMVRCLGDAEGAGGVIVEIVDDGVGFDVARVAPRRLGLATSIIQRVEVVGGIAQVDSAPGAGTAITLSWPAPSPEPTPTPDPAAATTVDQTAGEAAGRAAGEAAGDESEAWA